MRSDQQSAASNLLWAVVLLTSAAGATALASAYTAGYVLDTMHSTDALVLLVVDGDKLRSDSASLERNMSSATLALQSVRDFGIALAFGCVAVAVAVGVRVWKGRQSPK
jgi:hypothetical protein